MKNLIKKISKDSIIMCLCGFIIGVFIAYAISYCVYTKTVKNHNSNKETNKETVDKYDNYKLDNIDNKSDIQKLCTGLSGVITNIKKNGYIQIQVGEDAYDGYLYNSKGEVLYQGSNSDMAMYLSDGKSANYSATNGTLSINSSIDILRIIENVIKELDNGTDGFSIASMKYTVDESEDNINQYRIDIKGIDAIQKIYNIDAVPDFDDNIIEALKSSVGGTEAHVNFVVMWKDSQLAMVCNTVDSNGTESASWIMSGSIQLYDWELPESAYSTEFTTENSQKLYDILDDAITEINSMIEKYASDNSIDLSNITIDSDKNKEQTTDAETKSETETKSK